MTISRIQQRPRVLGAAALVAALSGSCGDGGKGDPGLDRDGTEEVATPLPEPPALIDPDPSRLIYDPNDPDATALAGRIGIDGASGAVEPGVDVVFTNLLTGFTESVSANNSGAFAIIIEAETGDWLRVEARRDDLWSNPVTVLVVTEGLELLELPSCVSLLPGARSTGETVSVLNRCDEDIVVQPATSNPDAAVVVFEPEIASNGLTLAPEETLRVELQSDQGRVIVLLPIEVDGGLMPYSIVFER